MKGREKGKERDSTGLERSKDREDRVEENGRISGIGERKWKLKMSVWEGLERDERERGRQAG
jgi:hypothetical protein